MKSSKVLVTIGLVTTSFFSLANAQGNLFYSETKTLSGMKSSSTVIQSLKNNDSYKSMEMIGLNVEALNQDNKTINLNFDNKTTLKTHQTDTYRIDDESFAWVGEIDLGLDQKHGMFSENLEALNPNKAIFVVRGNRVFGQVTIENEVFEIRTLEEASGYVLIKRDFSILGSVDDTPQDNLVFGLNSQELNTPLTYNPEQNKANKVQQLIEGPDGTKSSSHDDYFKYIDVMQVATTDATNAAGGTDAIVDVMLFFIAQSNYVYSQNSLYLRMRNAGLYISGAEPRVSPGRLGALFSRTGDGYLDSVPTTLRDFNRADMVVHVTQHLRQSGLCGVAASIGAEQENSYFLVNHDCTNFTFVHEAGHLIGARHDNDNTGTPFNFGRGYVNEEANFRTVMAVSSNPQPRIGLFSSTWRTYFGEQLGESYRNNELVHWFNGDYVAQFR